MKKEKKEVVENLVPLKSISYDAEVKGCFTKVKVRQIYENTMEQAIEAIYVFPLPDEAAIDSCKMKIGSREIDAVLKKRGEAKAEYRKAVDEGHHGVLMEQERPNIFTMNVGGIESKEIIEVSLTYIQRIPWQAGGGRFTIPLVVAPQFIPGKPTGSKQGGGWADDTDKVPDASRITPKVSKEGVEYRASISVLLSPGFVCKVCSPSHHTLIEERVIDIGGMHVKVEDISTDRDFVLQYASISDIVDSAVHVGYFGEEKFLSVSIIPPVDTNPVPTDIVFVLDCSGSMDGVSIAGLKIVTKKVIQNLKEQNLDCRVGIVPFNNEPLLIYPISEISENTEKFINGLEAEGGTMLGLALKKAESMFEVNSSRQRIIFMVTDGDTEDGRDWYGNGIRLIGMGISTAINDTTLKELTRRNLGVAEFVYPGEDYGVIAGRLLGYFSGPVLQSVKVVSKGDIVGVGDVYKGRPVVIVGRFDKGKEVDIQISGKTSDGGDWKWGSPEQVGMEQCSYVPQIWAREYIRESIGKDNIGRQVDISLKYGVICQYTSFVGISEKEVPGQKPVKVEIPVNLPYGWNYDKVFGQATRGGSVLRCSSARYGGAQGMSVDSCMVEEVDMKSLYTRSLKQNYPVGVIDIVQRQEYDFLLTTDNKSNRIVGILIAMAKGNYDEAKEAFDNLNLTEEEIALWTEEEKHRTLYFLMRLVPYGLKVEKTIIDALTSKKPLESTIEAVWLQLAENEIGVRDMRFSLVVDNDWADYLNWKTGKAMKPESSIWAQIP